MVIDFETRSRVDLRKCGTSVYARHPSTSILCLAYGRRQDDVQIWIPGQGEPTPEALLEAIYWGAETIEAHNAFFERNIWYWICHQKFGWPDVREDRWRCSLAACSRLALPRGLDDAAAALGLVIRKDAEGAKVMQRLSKPKKPSKSDPSEWDNDPAKLQRLYEYCKQDVRAEIALGQAIGELPKPELKLWQLDQKINLRGLKIDKPAVEHAMKIVNDASDDSSEEISRLTEGRVSTGKQVSALIAEIKRDCGEEIPDLAAETVSEWLAREDLTPKTRAILEVRQRSSQASTAKLEAMLGRADEDDRVRGTFFYHGAATGRWAGAGIQPHNYPRGVLTPDQIELVHQVLPSLDCEILDLIFGSITKTVSSCLRSFIIAEDGKRLMVCDFASIEARVLAWIANQEDLLELFRTGGDPYKSMASEIYKVDLEEVTKPQRQIGKVAILGLGYGMSHRAFRDACKAMAGVEIDAKFSKQVVKTYREANDRIAAFWREINTACIRAIETLQPHRVGRLEVSCEPDWLRIKLPSGRSLHYRRPNLVEVTAPWSDGYEGMLCLEPAQESWAEDQDIELGERSGNWIQCRVPRAVKRQLDDLKIPYELEKQEPQTIKQIQYWGVNSVSRKWQRQRTYGGKLCENVVQAIARDFLAEAMVRVESAGYPIVGTVHDEILCEVDEGFGSLASLESLMNQVPSWGRGCPIGVEGYESKRYRK